METYPGTVRAIVIKRRVLALIARSLDSHPHLAQLLFKCTAPAKRFLELYLGIP